MAVNVNPNIIMGFRGPQINNPLAVAAQAESVKSARMQNALAQAQIDAMPAKAEQEAKAKAMEIGKQLFGQTNSAAEFNAKMDSYVGPDVGSQFHVADDETFKQVQSRLYPDKGMSSQAKPTLIKTGQSQLLVDSQGKVIAEYGAPPASSSQDTEIVDLKKQLLQGQIDQQGQPKPLTTEQQKLQNLKIKELEMKTTPSDESVYEAGDAIALIDELTSEGSGFGSIYGTFSGATPNIMQSSVDAAAKRDQVVSLLQLAARGKLKGQGPITDSEQKMLANSATILANPRISEDAAMAEMERARLFFNRAINKASIKGMPKQVMPDPMEGKTATNPATGEKLVRRNGQWVPAQ